MQKSSLAVLLAVLTNGMGSEAPLFQTEGDAIRAQWVGNGSLVVRLGANGHSQEGWTETKREPTGPDGPAVGERKVRLAFANGVLALTRTFSPSGNGLAVSESWATEGDAIEGHIRFDLQIHTDEFAGGEISTENKTADPIDDLPKVENPSPIFSDDSTTLLRIAGLHGKTVEIEMSRPGKVEVLAQPPDAQGRTRLDLRVYWPTEGGGQLTADLFDWTLKVSP
jgi:hypothetical protein